MKFITSLKFLVLLIVALSVFTKMVKRSSTASKVLTKIAANAEAESFCVEDGKLKIDARWLLIDTYSANSGRSGVIVKNYYNNQSFNCRGFVQLANSGNKKQYFIPYRHFSQYNGPTSLENGWVYMRQLEIVLINSSYVYMNIDKKVFTDDINETELKNMVTNLDHNQKNFMTKFRQYREWMIYDSSRAHFLYDQQQKNISTKSDLQREITTKKIS